MSVSKQQKLQKYEKALLDAFPTWNDMERMVFYALGEHLEVVVGQGALQDVVFRLVRWAEAQGRLEELMRGAREQNPGNKLLGATKSRLRSKADSGGDGGGGRGAFITGNVNLNGGTFVGRDQINIQIHLPDGKESMDQKNPDETELS
jgi:hypothetical protein